jgi:hypothetical protein
MSYRRRHRWFRRMALGLAFASVLFAGRVSVAAAKFDEGTNGSRYVAAGGWSGQVDMESGIPESAGIPHGDEQFIDPQAVQVIPYLSQGMLSESDELAFANAVVAAAESLHDPIGPGEQERIAAGAAIHDRYPSVGSRRPDGDELAIRNAIEAQTLAAAEAIRDPYVSPGVLGEAVKTNVADLKFVPGVTDFPKTSQPIVADLKFVPGVTDFPATSQPTSQVIPYFSHGLTSDDVVGARPDDKADRFAHSSVQTPAEVSASGSTFEWNDALTVGIGALVLVLGLGLALGYLRRPRLAGL